MVCNPSPVHCCCHTLVLFTAEFLANAINAGKFEEAHKVINMLQKMAQAKPGKKLSISYTDGPATVPDDVDVT